METRISKIKHFGKIIAGVDNNNVFKEGHVYSFIKIEGVIVCEDLGEHAEQENFKFRRFWEIMMEGIYLLTKKEYKSIKNGK